MQRLATNVPLAPSSRLRCRHSSRVGRAWRRVHRAIPLGWWPTSLRSVAGTMRHPWRTAMTLQRCDQATRAASRCCEPHRDIRGRPARRAGRGQASRCAMCRRVRQLPEDTASTAVVRSRHRPRRGRARRRAARRCPRRCATRKVRHRNQTRRGTVRRRCGHDSASTRRDRCTMRESECFRPRHWRAQGRRCPPPLQSRHRR